MLYIALRYITILSLALVPFLSNSQILNIEKFRLDKDTFNIWMGNASFGFSARQQQNFTSDYNSNLNLVYLAKKHSYMSINHLNVDQINKVSFVSEGYTHWRANFWRKKAVSCEPFFQWQYDKGRGLEERMLTGISIRDNFLKNKFKKENVELGIGTGIMYEYEHWQGTITRTEYSYDSLNAYTSFLKNTTNLFTRLALHDNITFFASIYYQSRFNDFLNPRIISDVQLVMKITKAIAIGYQFTSHYDSRPIITGNIYTYNMSGNLILKLKD
jgi:hypothetical protein